MRKRLIRFTAIVMALLMVSGITGACEKTDNNAASTTAVAKTTAKVTATTAKATAAMASAATTAKETAATSAAIPAGISESISDKSESSTILNEADSYEKNLEQVIIGLGTNDFSAGDIDLGGRTLTYSSWGETLNPGDAQGKTPDLVLQYLKIKEAEKKYNFLFAIRTMTNFTQYRDTIISETLAGIKFADVIRTSSTHAFPAFISQGVILPLDDYIDFSSPIVKANSVMSQGSVWNNKHYGLSASFELGYARTIFNNALLEREGQPNILDLVEKDQWNWESFLNVCINCTKDMDGDGITDQWGICTYPGGLSYDLTLQILYSNGVTCVDFDKNGELVYALTKPEAYRALQFAWDLVNVYKVHKFEPTGNPYLPDNYGKGKVAMYINTQTFNRDALVTGMQSYIAPLPKGPDVDTYQNIASLSAMSVIPVTCKDPRETARVWFETCILWDENGNKSTEYQELCEKAVPYDYNWSTANLSRRYSTEREDKITLKPLYKNFKVDYTLGYPTSLQNTLIYNQICKGILSGNNSVSSLVTQIESAAQELIDQYQ